MGTCTPSTYICRRSGFGFGLSPPATSCDDDSVYQPSCRTETFAAGPPARSNWIAGWSALARARALRSTLLLALGEALELPMPLRTAASLCDGGLPPTNCDATGPCQLLC